MKEDTKDYWFLKPYRYSINGSNMVNSFPKDHPDTKGPTALTKFYSERWLKDGIIELAEVEVEKKVDEPENKMLEVEKETKAPKPTFKKKATIKKK